jgi:hypothetical protein
VPAADREVEAAVRRDGGAGPFGHECRAGSRYLVGVGQSLEFVVHVAPALGLRRRVRLNIITTVRPGITRVAIPAGPF